MTERATKRSRSSSLMEMPKMGLGTFEINSRETIIKAFEIGYRHLDIAEAYHNLPVIKDSLIRAFQPLNDGGLGLHRNDIWLTMKVFRINNDKHIDELLKQLGLEYFDLLMYHTPSSHFGDCLSMQKHWLEMIYEKSKGNTKQIGVSNYYEQHLDILIKFCEDHYFEKPFANEIQFNPYVQPINLIRKCESLNIEIIAYCPLGYTCSNMLLNDENVLNVAAAFNKSSAQVVLAWLLRQNVAVIPRSSNEKHLLENFQSLDKDFLTSFNADPNQIEMVKSLNRYPHVNWQLYWIDCSLKASSQSINWKI